MLILFVKLLYVDIICPNKGDILVRPEDRGNSSFANAHLADPKMLWPSGMVEYKFYRSFPRCLNIFFSLPAAQKTAYHISIANPQGPDGLDEEGHGLHHQVEPLHQLCPGQQLKPQLRHHRQWPDLLERGGYEGRGAVALHERRLLRQRFDCARARVDAYARLRARAQSDTGVGRILVFPLAFPEFFRKGLGKSRNPGNP